MLVVSGIVAQTMNDLSREDLSRGMCAIRRLEKDKKICFIKRGSYLAGRGSLTARGAAAGSFPASIPDEGLSQKSFLFLHLQACVYFSKFSAYTLVHVVRVDFVQGSTTGGHRQHCQLDAVASFSFIFQQQHILFLGCAYLPRLCSAPLLVASCSVLS